MIGLVNPPAPFLIDQRVFPNLGTLRIATQMKRDGFDVDVIDLLGDPKPRETMRNRARDYDVLGFTSTSPQFPQTFDLAQVAKEEGTRIVLGGAHASAISALRRKGIKDKNIDNLELFDVVLDGEAEQDYMSFLTDGEKWRSAELIKNLDDTVIPDRSLIDIDSYKYKLNGRKTTNMMTQRGCPYQCTFCCGRDIPMYNKVRMHSPERVVEEMDQLNERHGYDAFMWYDDEVNLNTDRLVELCERLEDRDYIHRGFVRSDQIVKHPETVEAMKRAGFVKLCAGVESGDEHILEILDKRVTPEMNLEAAQRIKEAGIHYESFLLIGHPYESEETIEKTKEWVRQAQPDDFDINIVVPYPGSKMYDEAKPSFEKPGYSFQWGGLYFNKPDYSKDQTYYKGLGGQSAGNTRTTFLKHNELVQIRNEMEEELR